MQVRNPNETQNIYAVVVNDPRNKPFFDLVANSNINNKAKEKLLLNLKYSLLELYKDDALTDQARAKLLRTFSHSAGALQDNVNKLYSFYQDLSKKYGQDIPDRGLISHFLMNNEDHLATAIRALTNLDNAGILLNEYGENQGYFDLSDLEIKWQTGLVADCVLDLYNNNIRDRDYFQLLKHQSNRNSRSCNGELYSKTVSLVLSQISDKAVVMDMFRVINQCSNVYKGAESALALHKAGFSYESCKVLYKKKNRSPAAMTRGILQQSPVQEETQNDQPTTSSSVLLPPLSSLLPQSISSFGAPYNGREASVLRPVAVSKVNDVNLVPATQMATSSSSQVTSRHALHSSKPKLSENKKQGEKRAIISNETAVASKDSLPSVSLRSKNSAFSTFSSEAKQASQSGGSNKKQKTSDDRQTARALFGLFQLQAAAPAVQGAEVQIIGSDINPLRTLSHAVSMDKEEHFTVKIEPQSPKNG